MEKKKNNNDEPVIIRRAVIINNDDEKKEPEKNKKKEVGFIEKKRNKDYNIVYRDKPTKPLTVSELLGIAKKKKEPEKVEEKEEKLDKNESGFIRKTVLTLLVR